MMKGEEGIGVESAMHGLWCRGRHEREHWEEPGLRILSPSWVTKAGDVVFNPEMLVRQVGIGRPEFGALPPSISEHPPLQSPCTL
jgi:hypothetical protein